MSLRTMRIVAAIIGIVSMAVGCVMFVIALVRFLGE